MVNAIVLIIYLFVIGANVRAFIRDHLDDNNEAVSYFDAQQSNPRSRP